MQKQLEQELKSIISFGALKAIENIQELWSGYGALLRAQLTDCAYKSVIVKRIAAPPEKTHPRGWNSDLGHQRKLKSYQVEMYWYEHYNQLTNSECRTAKLIGAKHFSTHTSLVLEDLNKAGYALRKSSLNTAEIKSCLSWLANFHALFMHHNGNGLWPIGTYWQLDTRPDEWKVIEDAPLKQQAQKIHKKLNQAKYQCLVHGDAKYANFCFSEDNKVAAVDFQYVGKGCGMKDVVYLLSCIPEYLSDKEQEEYLTHYFTTLQKSLKPEDQTHFSAIEAEWRSLYPFAWADFQRFLAGWAPNHWKSNGTAQQQITIALKNLL